MIILFECSEEFIIYLMQAHSYWVKMQSVSRALFWINIKWGTVLTIDDNNRVTGYLVMKT